MPTKFECSRQIELPASPDHVWAAVATSHGNASWLFPNEIEPGVGADNPNVVWDPPRRFAVRMENGAWFNMLDFAIELRGDSSLLHYCHTGVFFDNFEIQNEGIQQHTDFYLHTLGQYLRYFSPRTATYVGDMPGGIQGPPESSQPGGFERLKAALGVSDGISEGDSVRLTPQGVGPLDGVVDYLRPNFVGIRTADGLYRFFGRNAFGAPIGVTLHLFGNGVDAEHRSKRGSPG